VNKMVEEGINMDFPTENMGDSERRVTAALTAIRELLGHISNHLGSPIDFEKKPTIKNPTSKKVDVGGTMFTDDSSLGNKAIPRGAAKPNKEKVTKAPKVGNFTRNYTGSLLEKEDEEKLWPILTVGETGALTGAAVKDTLKPDDDEVEGMEKAMNPMSTSEGKELLSTLEDAVKKLKKYLTTTRVPSSEVLKPMDVRPQ